MNKSDAVLGIALLLVLGVCAGVGLPAEPTANVDRGAAAADLVRAALLAEASGNRESHDELLREAMKNDPDYRLAHWCAGEVRRDQQWLSLDEAQRQAANDRQLAEYRKLRDQHADTPADQIVLGRWCRNHGLLAEGRAHWMQVLMAQPQNAEAMKALGAQWYQGQLLTDAQVKQAEQANSMQARAALSKKQRQWMDHWETLVVRWRHALKAGEASVRESLRSEVTAARDPLAIHTLGTVLINGSRQNSDPKGYRSLSLALIDALRSRGEPWAAVQLARHAVEHPTMEVCNAAGDALKERPKVSYVPWLLSYMQSPIEASVVVSGDGEGGVLIHQTLEQEDPDAVYRDVRQQFYCAGTPTINIYQVSPQLGIYDSNVPQVLQASWRDAEKYKAATQDQVDQVNAKITDLNRRIQHAISRATGEEMDADAVSWQRWWTKYCCDYYELEQVASDPSTDGSSNYQYPYDPQPSQTGDKPVVEQQRTYGTPAYIQVNVNEVGSSGAIDITGLGLISTINITPIAIHLQSCCCFPWNTKVWTLTGPVDIAQIKPGDCVLSQQPLTGELSYQPVLQVTRRHPAPMIEIGLGSETIRATRGHPFWVCGEGWKMGKQLEVGMWLHSVGGPIRIDRVDKVPAARPWYEQPDAKPGEELSYNLVMDGCHNYFIGQEKVLVHDNIFFPLDGPVPAVPGLASP